MCSSARRRLSIPDRVRLHSSRGYDLGRLLIRYVLPIVASALIPAAAAAQAPNGNCDPGMGVTTYCVVSLLVDGNAPPAHIIASVFPPDPGQTLVNISVENTTNADIQELASNAPAGLTVNSEVTVVVQLPAAYTPTLALSSGLLEEWDFDPATDQVTLVARPRGSSFNVTDGCDPFSGCANQAETDFEALLILNVDQLAAFPGDPADIVAAIAKSEGMSISTNAQAFGVPVFAGDLAEFALDLAAPHLKLDGSLNTGFFEIFLPNPLLTDVWGLDPATLTSGKFSVAVEEGGTSTTVTVQIQDKAASNNFPAGKVLSFDDLSYSTPTLKVAPNVAPVANDDDYATTEDMALIATAGIGLLFNDSDANGDGLTATKTSDPATGALAFSTDGSFTYTPLADFAGSVSFTYRANDGVSESADATVTITVNATNDAPVAADDDYSTAEDKTLNVAAAGVLANDSDADGDSLTATKTSDPVNGTLVFNANGSFDYTPNADFNGTDSFRYKATDGSVESAEATVTITVDTANDAPVAAADNVVAEADRTLIVSAPGVLENDSDADSDALTASVASGPGKGSLSLSADGSFTYTPNVDSSGSDAFTYIVSDGKETDTATVTITVPACTYGLDPTSQQVGHGGGDHTLTVTTQSTCSRSATSNQTWIAVAGGAVGTGTGTVFYSVDENPGALSRSGTVTASGQKLSVEQEGAPLVFRISPSEASFAHGGGTVTVQVVATPDASWTATQVPWARLVGAGGGDGDGSVEYSVSENESPDARSAQLTVAGETITISQAGKVVQTIAPWSLVPGDGTTSRSASLDGIGVFGIEDRGRARGPWLQAFDGNGEVRLDTFLPRGLEDGGTFSAQLDGFGEPEIVVVGSDGARFVLYVRDDDGDAAARRVLFDGGPADEVVAMLIRRGGDTLIGVAARRGEDGAGLFELWRFERRSGDDRLVPLESHVVVEGGFAHHAWRRADLDGDGDDEVIVGYARPDSLGAWFRVFDPESGNVLAERQALGQRFTDVNWMVGSFRGHGPEILLGARHASSGVGFLTLFEGTGKRVMRGKVTPPGAEELFWRPIRAGDVEQVLVGYRQSAGDWAYQVRDMTAGKPARVGGAVIASSDQELNDWVIGDFDGLSSNGFEIAAMVTDTRSREIWCSYWSRHGSELAAPVSVMDSSHIDPRALALRPIRADRDDLMILANRVGARPRVLLLRLDGTRLLEFSVLGPAVR